MSPTGKSYSFRACVRAKLRVPAGRCCFRGWAPGARKVLRVGACACRVPACRCGPVCLSMLNDAKRVNTCYSMLFNAYRRYSMLFCAILRYSMLFRSSCPPPPFRLASLAGLLNDAKSLLNDANRVNTCYSMLFNA